MRPFQYLLNARRVIVWITLGGLSLLAGANELGTKPIRKAATWEDPQNAAVIVKYKPGGAWSRPFTQQANQLPEPRHAAKITTTLGLNAKDGRVLGTHIQSLTATGLSSSVLANRLRTLPDVEWVTVDRISRISSVPNDPYLADGLVSVTPTAGQWYLRAPSADIPAAINATGAWDITQGSPNLVVAVVDTGIRPDHPDFAGKLVTGYDFVRNPFMALDGGGRDGFPGDPGDWTVNNQCGPGEPGEASSWHGTQTAGLIGAATNNGIGIAGMGYNVKVMPIRALGRCGGYESDIIAGMLWAAGLIKDVGYGKREIKVNASPAKVLNLSLGGDYACSPAYQDAINRLTAANVAVVVAAGNSSTAVGTPANCSGVIAVAALRHVGNKTGFSSLGPEVSISAPGGNCVNTAYSEPCLYPIMSTTNWGSTRPTLNGYSDSYLRPAMGTSFSTPLVAGTVALMMSVQPTMSVSDLKAALMDSATPFPTTDPGGASTAPMCVSVNDEPYQGACYCTTSTCGAGMLNAAAAVAKVAPPLVQITPSSTSARVGSNIVLNSAGSAARSGRTIVSYEWSIVNPQGVVEFVGVTTGTVATIRLIRPSPFTVRLTVTDSAGYRSQEQVALSVMR